MKLRRKIIWRFAFLLLINISLLLLTKSEVRAFCMTNATDSNCDPDIYDCSNNEQSTPGNNPAFCSSFPDKNYCYEVVTMPGGPMGDNVFTFCYLKKSQPTPPPATCGREGDICCPAPDFCDPGLINQSLGGSPPICRCIVPTSPFPTNLPNPTGPVYYLTDVNCDPGTGNVRDGVNTAIGCIPINNFDELIGWLLSKLIFVASGIAFLLMVIGAIQILTSAGNPDKVKAGKELITSALSGLLFIILSIFLLKLIGVDILHIPGL